MQQGAKGLGSRTKLGRIREGDGGGHGARWSGEEFGGKGVHLSTSCTNLHWMQQGVKEGVGVKDEVGEKSGGEGGRVVPGGEGRVWGEGNAPQHWLLWGSCHRLWQLRWW